MLGPWQPADVAETKRLFERIRAAHAHLHMVLDTEPRRVDLEMTIPEQLGLSFPLHLNQQGDELHLEAGDHFRLEFFPGYERQVADRYFDAVDGLLAGRYRVVEHYRGARAVRAELQAPQGGGWRLLGTWSKLGIPIPWRKRHRILVNA